MATVFVLYINDPVVTPCLELIRKISNPFSKSKPHITVRYVEKLQKNDLKIYSETKVSEISLIEPDSFDSNEDNGNIVIFIKCASDILETLSHKPHFPDSVFHITLYEGSDKAFGLKILKLLKNIEWRFLVNLKEETELTRIELKTGKDKRTKKSDLLSTEIIDLFYNITGFQLTYDSLINFSKKERISFISYICDYLSTHTKAFKRIKNSNIGSYGGGDNISIWSKNLNNLTDNQNGFYLTPPELAIEITKYSLDLLGNEAINFGNPAVGTGVFFGALCNLVPVEKIASAIGIEVIPKRAKTTSERWSHKGLQVLMGDYLHMDKLPKRNLILANPPYVRYQHIEKEYGQLLRQRASIDIGMKIGGQSGLYVYFLLISHRWMSDNAIAAWLIPSEFMETNYGHSIRIYLTKNVELIRIHRFDFNDPQFENARVSSCIVVFKNKKPSENHTATFSCGGTLTSPNLREIVKISQLKNDRRWSIPKIKKENLNNPKIGDLFTVKRGIATGANDFFILKRSEAEQIGIPDIFLKPILPKARTIENDVIEKDKDGYPIVKKQLSIIDCDLSEENIKKSYPQFYKYLQSGIEKGLLSRSLIRARKIWYSQEKRNPTYFLCTYMGRGSKNFYPIRFLFNKSDAVATNSYLFLYPNEILSNAINENTVSLEEIFNLLKDIEKSGFEGYTRVYGGGLKKIEPKDLLEVHLTENPSWLKDIMNKELF